MKGTVVQIFLDKGFCFIRGEDGIRRFAHTSKIYPGLFDSLREGTEVEFMPVKTDRGNRAEDVKLPGSRHADFEALFQKK